MKIREQWKHALALLGAGRREETAQRKTMALPSILTPYSFPAKALPKPTPANLRKFAETPVVRRAINLIKDRVAAMDWQVRLKRDQRTGGVARFCRAGADSAAVAGVSESIGLVPDAAGAGYRGCAGGRLRRDRDGADGRSGIGRSSCGRWMAPRFASIPSGTAARNRCALRRRPAWRELDRVIPLKDNQLIYVRMNPRSYTPFGLGPLEVAFETVNSVSERASLCREAGQQRGGAVCAVAERDRRRCSMSG